jgi:hypothetical protein
MYEGVSKSFRTESITKYTLTTINTRWETTQSVMAIKITRLTRKIAIQLHLVAESCTICSSRSRRPVRKLLDIPSYTQLTTYFGAAITQWYSAELRLNDRGFESRQGLGIFPFCTASRPTLRPTQPPIQRVSGALSLGVKLTTHLYLVPRSRMRGAIPRLPHTPSWRGAQLKHRDNFTLTTYMAVCSSWYLICRWNYSLPLCIQHSPPVDPNAGQLNPVPIPRSCISKVHSAPNVALKESACLLPICDVLDFIFCPITEYP